MQDKVDAPTINSFKHYLERRRNRQMDFFMDLLVPKSYGCTTTTYYYSCIFRKKVPGAAAPGKNPAETDSVKTYPRLVRTSFLVRRPAKVLFTTDCSTAQPAKAAWSVVNAFATDSLPGHWDSRTAATE